MRVSGRHSNQRCFMPFTQKNLKMPLRYYTEISSRKKQDAGFAKVVANVSRSKFPFRYQRLIVMKEFISGLNFNDLNTDYNIKNSLNQQVPLQRTERISVYL